MSANETLGFGGCYGGEPKSILGKAKIVMIHAIFFT